MQVGDKICVTSAGGEHAGKTMFIRKVLSDTIIGIGITSRKALEVDKNYVFVKENYEGKHRPSFKKGDKVVNTSGWLSSKEILEITSVSASSVFVINIETNESHTLSIDNIEHANVFNFKPSLIKGEAIMYKGAIEGFPKEVVELMLKRQEEAGNFRNVHVFEAEKFAGTGSKGFNWHQSPEGKSFWEQVIENKNFDHFFEKYPKKTINHLNKTNNVGNITKVVLRTNSRIVRGKRIKGESKSSRKSRPSIVNGYSGNVRRT